MPAISVPRVSRHLSPVTCHLFFSVLCATTAHAIEKHPELLEGEPGCDLYLGGASGNDPSIRLNLVLCRDGTRARGRVQWSSLASGWNVREVDGTITGDAIELRDVRILEARPQPGWRFCAIDRWSLKRSGTRVEGTYASAACDDRATVWFEKVPDADGGAAPGPSPSPGPSPTPPPSPTPTPSPEPDPKPDRCGCAAAPGPGGALLVLWLLVTRPGGGRRSAGRWRPGRPRRWRRSRS